MNKEKFIEWLNKQPNDIQIFMTQEGELKCVDIKIFTEYKNNEWLEEYFRP